MINHLTNRICKHCKKKFLTRKDRVYKFCSRICYELYRTENRAVYSCLHCNKKITFHSVKYGSGLCRSCECKIRLKNPKNHPMFGQHHSIETKQKLSDSNKGKNGSNFGKRGKESTHFIHGKYGKNYHTYCLICNKELSGPNAKYCKICQSKIRIGHKRPEHSKRMQKENNPNWNNGSSFEPYSLEWTKELKESIRKRDNYTCQNPKCNCPQGENDKSLDVHHMDYNKENCKEYNLIALCKSCHTKTNYNRDYWYAYYKYVIDNKSKNLIERR